MGGDEDKSPQNSISSRKRTWGDAATSSIILKSYETEGVIENVDDRVESETRGSNEGIINEGASDEEKVNDRGVAEARGNEGIKEGPSDEELEDDAEDMTSDSSSNDGQGPPVARYESDSQSTAASASSVISSAPPLDPEPPRTRKRRRAIFPGSEAFTDAVQLGIELL